MQLKEELVLTLLVNKPISEGKTLSSFSHCMHAYYNVLLLLLLLRIDGKTLLLLLLLLFRNDVALQTEITTTAPAAASIHP